MMDLAIIERDGRFVVDSRDVSIMVDKRHDHLIRDIENYCNVLETPSLGNGINIDVSEFFISSSYASSSNSREYKCYLLTKKGCDMVANKMTGEKGVLFTAAYITKFDEMEAQIKSTQIKLPNNYIEALRALALAEEEKLKMKENDDYCRKVLLPPNLKTTTEIAKDLGMSAQKLNTLLHELKLIYKKGNTWYLYANYEHLVPECCDYHINEYGQLLKWTEKGRQFIIENINK